MSSDSEKRPLKLADRAGSLRAVLGKLEANADELARLQATESRATDQEAKALAGKRLGAGAVRSFLRALGEKPKRTTKPFARSLLGPSALTVRSSLAETLARGRVDLLPGPAKAGAEPSEGKSLVFTDSLSTGIPLCLALREVFVRGQSPVVVVREELRELIDQVLSPLAGEVGLSVIAGDAEHALSSGRESSVVSVSIVGSAAARKTLAPLGNISGSSGAGERCGFSTDSPSTFVLLPFLYDKRELVRIARMIVAEVTSPPCGSASVEVLSARGWLSRGVFRAELEKEIARVASGLEVSFRTPGEIDKSGRLTFTEVDADEPGELLARAGDLLRHSVTTDRDEERWMVSVVASDHLLGLPSWVDPIRSFLAELPVSNWGLGARASLAWLDGRVPVGPKGSAVQNAWSLSPTEKVIVSGALRRSLCGKPSSDSAMLRFEQAPSLGSAAGVILSAVR